MADLGSVGAFARTGDLGALGSGLTPAVPVGFTGRNQYGTIGLTSGDGAPQPVNPVVQRRNQMFTGDALLTSD